MRVDCFDIDEDTTTAGDNQIVKRLLLISQRQADLKIRGREYLDCGKDATNPADR
jgi:hypothetical protein